MKKLGVDKKVKIAAGFGGESESESHQDLPQGTFLNVPVESLKPNPYQPRQVFNQEELAVLGDSIYAHGILLPLCIFIENGEYFIGDGERRWRAAMLVCKKTVPCYVTAGKPAEIALIGNMLRSDLTPLEEAAAYARMQKEFGYTHQELARVVGKSRNNITETLSLNRLPAPIREECLRVDIPKRKLIKIARMETPEAMEEAANLAMGRKEVRAPKKKDPSKKWMSHRILKLAKDAESLNAVEESLRLREASHAEFRTEMKPTEECAAFNEALEKLRATIDSTFPSLMRNYPEEPLNLSGACSVKLLRAGFRIFRTQEYAKAIKELTNNGGWKLVSRHKTKKAMNEAMAEVLQDPMSVKN